MPVRDPEALGADRAQQRVRTEVPVRFETRRAASAVGNGDHQTQSRSEKIRGLVRMELLAIGGGEPSLGQWGLSPHRILEAVDDSPWLPASGLWVRRPTSEPTREDRLSALRDARHAREKPSAECTPDEMLVRLAVIDAVGGTDLARAWAELHDLDVYKTTQAPASPAGAPDGETSW